MAFFLSDISVCLKHYSAIGTMSFVNYLLFILYVLIVFVPFCILFTDVDRLIILKMMEKILKNSGGSREGSAGSPEPTLCPGSLNIP